MTRYIVLIDACYDWSGGEYGYSYVENIFLGFVESDKDPDAKIKAEKLQKTFYEQNYDVIQNECSLTVSKI